MCNHRSACIKLQIIDNWFALWKLVVNKRRVVTARTKTDQFTDLILTVFRLNGVMTDWGDHFASAEGLSSARWQMLGGVAMGDRPVTAPQVGARMGVSRQGAQKQLNVLVAAGLMEAQPNPMHKRSPLYALTQHGRATLDSIDSRWRGHAAHAAAAFSTADLETAAKVLTTLIALHGSTHLEQEA